MKLSLVACLLLTACAADVESGVNRTITVEDPELTGSVQAAVDEWNSACPNAGLRMGLGGVLVRVGDPGEGHGGRTRSGGDVTVRVQTLPDMTRVLLVHELGHVLGLGHRPGGVMDADRLTVDRHVTAEDCEGIDSERE